MGYDHVTLFPRSFRQDDLSGHPGLRRRMGWVWREMGAQLLSGRSLQSLGWKELPDAVEVGRKRRGQMSIVLEKEFADHQNPGFSGWGEEETGRWLQMSSLKMQDGSVQRQSWEWGRRNSSLGWRWVTNRERVVSFIYFVLQSRAKPIQLAGNVCAPALHLAQHTL